ncbi:uncharacterized protein I206_102342 [Kwoniella pini CBS 10737]|uniref:Zn(2)-C6 fungal-type domain-containing protein n=1 Tax=Kwoniella pini CBS 10737 TaxID=1296096 RepID=A0A1B9I537_9TREE|nr:uncharacterized protein I206_02689 [Kwoniella pini CBS 10737]OCF50635.1 hypothetical protein I206_02689 [Kwoniella pini CBS 10737]
MSGYSEEDYKDFKSFSMSGESFNAPLKKRRITRACDRCHRGGTKCSPGPTPSICGPCASFGSECTFLRPVKRRGPAARSHSHDENHHYPSSGGTSAPDSPSTRDDHWVYHEIASHEQIEELVEAYYRIIYPIQAYFHWPTFVSAINKRLYRKSRSFYCLTMAVCALAAARLRDGAPKEYHLKHELVPSEAYFQAIFTSFPTDLSKARDFDYKRTKVLLSMLCIQYGDISKAILHIGDYCTLISIDGFSLESRWPKGLNTIEIEERRRLYWNAYQADIYLATTFGGMIRHRESQSTVLYPAEVLTDDEITPDGILPHAIPGRVSFIRGWNFVTNLYRIIEHALCQMRQRNQSYDGENQIAMLFSTKKVGAKKYDPGPEEILQTVENLYKDLPDCMRGMKEMTGNTFEDRYGFQAANILITLQIVKMVIAGMAEWSVEQRCAIAGELLDSLSALPADFIRACSAPMLHHMAGVGHLLASIIQSPISPSAYLKVRTILLRLADLLSSLESTIKSASVICIAAKLRDHVERIDEYMINATEATGWNFALNSNTDSDTLQTSAHSAYQSSEPLIYNPRPSEHNSSAQRSTQSNELINFPQIPNYPPLLPNSNIDELIQPSMQDESTTQTQLDQQLKLPNDLFSDWSFMFNEFGSQGDAFDFLSTGIPTNGDWQVPGVSNV